MRNLILRFEIITMAARKDVGNRLYEFPEDFWKSSRTIHTRGDLSPNLDSKSARKRATGRRHLIHRAVHVDVQPERLPGRIRQSPPTDLLMVSRPKIRSVSCSQAAINLGQHHDASGSL